MALLDDAQYPQLSAAALGGEQQRGVEHVAARPRQRHEKLPELSPGTVIEHYELIRKLGSGGMGLVFLARDVRLGRLVAVKFLLVETRVAVERFVVEARATASCRHENIVVIYDVGEVAGFTYLVLEYIPGRTLREVMQEAILDRVKLAIELLLPVARALECAHAMGIIHRDLKPENILISDTGQVKVVDFGIAKQIADADPRFGSKDFHRGSRRPLTEDGAFVGTTDYMSPEQWLGEPLDARVDIWAIGLVLFELSTGVHPLELLVADESGDISMLDVPMPSAADELSGHFELARIIDKCLRKRVDDRLGSARELVDALETLQHQEHQAQAIATGGSPFAGLSAFQESDAGHFFGRENEIAAVLARLRQEPLVAIAGPSGAGKSSFVRAGVVPALKRAYRDMEVCVVRPGRHPVAALADILISFENAEADRDSLTEMLRTQPGHLGAQLRARCKKRGKGQRLVLFVDQFEELYTQGIETSERAAFHACVEGAADDASSPLRVIITIRSDFLDRVTEDRRHLSPMTRELFFLAPMTNDGLRQALEKPLESVGYRFEDDKLVGDMLSGLAGTKSPLPLLQFVASKLWEARDQERRLLTREAYTALGGVAGALSTHADAVLAAMTATERRLLRSILLRLVTPDKTRAVLQWNDVLAMSNEASAVIEHLADARLVSIEAGRGDDERTVELTHESLIEGWTTLRQLLHANESDARFLADLRSAAAQWETKGRMDDFLWRDRTAQDAGRWLVQYRENAIEDEKVELSAREVDYLEAVVGLANRTKRKRARLIFGAMAILIIMVFVVSILGLQAKREAQRADTKAVEAAQKAEEAKLNALEARNATHLAAASEHRSDATLALSLLREMDPTVALPPKWDELAQWMLYQNIAEAVLTHDVPTEGAEFSPDGEHIVTVAWDHSARVWSSDGREKPLLLEGHGDQIHRAAYSVDGKRIVTASSDKTARIWNADGSGKSIVLEGHQGAVMSAAFSPDGLRVVTGSTDKTVRFWNADGGGSPIVREGHQDTVNAVAFSPDGKRVVTASNDGTIRIWNSDGEGEAIVLQAHHDHIFSAAFSPDGKRIVTASFDSTARVWNADGTGKPILLAGHSNSVRSAAFSPDGRHVVTASWDQTVRIWNADGSGSPIVLSGHRDKVHGAAFSADGNHIVTASLDKTVRVWKSANTAKLVRLEGHEGTIVSAAFSPDGRRIVTASLDKTARVWHANGKTALAVLRGHGDKILSAAFSPDGRHVVTASQDRTIRTWDVETGLEEMVLRGHTDAVWSAVYSPDGGRIVSASWDKTIRIWDASGHSEPVVLRGHENAISSAGMSPDGAYIVSASDDKTVRIWNVNGIGEPGVLRGHDAAVYSAAFSPDGRRILTASWDKTARLWKADGSDEPLVFRHDAGVGAGAMGGIGAFTPDGSRFITIADDKTVRIWSSDGLGEPFVMRIPDLFPTIVAFSPDGSRFVTASHEQKDSTTGTTRYWATVRPAFDSLSGPDDDQLWSATTYCPPVALRRQLLGVSEKLAEEQLGRCKARVARAFDSALR